MSKLILVLGGTRSGKSRHAVETAKRYPEKTVFIATAAGLDAEMKERIRLHKIARPKVWKLVEEPLELSSALRGLNGSCGAAIIDCIGLWISNLLMADMSDRTIEKRIDELWKHIRTSKAGTVIVVSNEVGQGLVPADPVSRRFRDLVGRVNQVMAAGADEVIMMQAGIPVKIK